MTVLAIEALTLRIAGRTLLDNASLTIDSGRKVGLVGRNGAGKSTLLKAITGELAPDGGSVRLASRARLAHVAQEAPGGPRSLLDAVLDADLERAALLAEVAAEPPAGRLAELHDRLAAIGADAAPARAATILAGLGFDTAAQATPLSQWSGGWRMRVALARALFVQPDLLLLDEPTNHLDLEASLWLEGWLARFPGAAIVVSHDRGLLDRAVEAIAHLDQGKLTLTTGGYTEFERVRAERAAQRGAANAKITAERERMQAFVDRFRAKASKARQAQSRLKALQRLPPVSAVVEDSVSRFSFPDPPPLPPPMLALNGASVGYDGRAVLRGIDLRLDQEDRIALLGRNGNGKSTFAKLLAGRLTAMAGSVQRAGKLKVGFFAQHQAEELDPAGTPLSHMQHALPLATVQACRAQLARFGLDADRAETRIAACSGGEKARLLLALCTRDAPALLILDEPTNHLDIDARDALVRALADYGGAVVLITHDPHLVELVADRLWLVADGAVRPYDGDMDDYRALLLGRAPPKAAPAARRERAAPPAPKPPPPRDRLKRIEAELDTLRAEASKIDAALADPRLYARDNAALVAKATARRAVITRRVDALEGEWLTLSEAVEAA